LLSQEGKDMCPGKKDAKVPSSAKASSFVRPRDILVLKTIALLGGVNDHVQMSSGELGELLQTTQQTASLWILELLDRGYLVRRAGSRRQGLRLTPKAIDFLRQEHADYIRIFERSSVMDLQGLVISGLGEGKYYISRPEYKRQFKEKVSFVPFPGTLNVRLSGGDLSKVRILRDCDGMDIRGFQKDGRTFGSGKVFMATINGHECAVVIPLRTHYSDVVEVISKDYLRDELGVKDGDRVELKIKV
jgi:riboflavin kinase